MPSLMLVFVGFCWSWYVVNTYLGMTSNWTSISEAAIDTSAGAKKRQ